MVRVLDGDSGLPPRVGAECTQVELTLYKDTPSGGPDENGGVSQKPPSKADPGADLEADPGADPGTDPGAAVSTPRLSCLARLSELCTTHRTLLNWGVLLAGHALLIAYVTAAVIHWQNEVSAGRQEGLDWCTGLGLVFLLLAAVYGYLLFSLLSRRCGPFLQPLTLTLGKCTARPAYLRAGKWLVAAIALGLLVAFVILDVAGDWRRLRSLLGVLCFVLFGWVFSRYPGRVRWRPVLCGLGLQLLLGVLVVRWENGRVILECFGQRVVALLKCASNGSSFVYGSELVEKHPSLAFQVLPVIFFLSSIIQILEHLGAMQWLLYRVGSVLQLIMGTTVCESVNAAASVFLSMSESPLMIRPHIKDLTRSELHAVMGVGLATVAGTTMAAYISFGARAEHLMAASIMSTAGALAYSKLFYPETEESKTSLKNLRVEQSECSSVIDAAAKGACTGINIVLSIAASLVAFVSLVHLLNQIIGWLGGLVGQPQLSFEFLLGKLFVPVAWLIGADATDIETVATLIGLKTIVNEFYAFQKLGEFKAAGKLSPRSLAVTTYAICSFSNPTSMAIVISVLSSMAPSQRGNVSQVAVRALLTGILTSLLTASMAGFLMPADSLSLPNVVPGNATSSIVIGDQGA